MTDVVEKNMPHAAGCESHLVRFEVDVLPRLHTCRPISWFCPCESVSLCPCKRGNPQGTNDSKQGATNFLESCVLSKRLSMFKQKKSTTTPENCRSFPDIEVPRSLSTNSVELGWSSPPQTFLLWWPWPAWTICRKTWKTHCTFLFLMQLSHEPFLWMMKFLMIPSKKAVLIPKPKEWNTPQRRGCTWTPDQITSLCPCLPEWGKHRPPVALYNRGACIVSSHREHTGERLMLQVSLTPISRDWSAKYVFNVFKRAWKTNVRPVT